MFETKESRVKLLNSILILTLLLSFFMLFKFRLDFFKFHAYFLILLIGGLGILNQFELNLRSSTMYLVISLIVGIISNEILFLILTLLQINVAYSFVIIGGVGLILLLKTFKRTKMILRRIELLKDPLLFFTIIFVILYFFVISDNLYYLENKTIVTNPGGSPAYELGISQGLNYNFPVVDLSYSGKKMRYHFGYPIILFQLVNFFNINEMNLAYLVAPAFFVILLFLLLHLLSMVLIKKGGLRPLFISLMAFSALSIFNLNSSQIFLFLVGISGEGSYALAIPMLLILFFLIRLKPRHFLVEAIILTGIAITKSPFFITLAIGYSFAFFVSCLQDKNIKQFIMKSLILLPGTIYVLLFVLGAHQQDLWVIFPGEFNLLSTTLTPNGLIWNVFFSFFASIFYFIGLGLLYLFYIIKKIKNSKKISFNRPLFLFLGIIIMGYLVSFFFIEIIEGTQTLLLFPGYIFLSLLTYRYLLNKSPNFKIVVAVLVILLFINAANGIMYAYFYNSSKLVLESDRAPEKNNPFANLKLVFIEKVVSLGNLKNSINQRLCYFPNDLLNGLRFLSQQNKSVFTFNRIYESCHGDANQWVPSETNGFIRTAISKKQTIVEGHQSKGISAQSDYCERIFENLLFFSLITGKESQFESRIDSILNTKVLKYEELGYYPYFKLFDTNNYFTDFERFKECLREKKNDTDMPEMEKLDYLKEYLLKNKIDYLLFERAEKPLDKYAADFNLKPIFSVGNTTIYEVVTI